MWSVSVCSAATSTPSVCDVLRVLALSCCYQSSRVSPWCAARLVSVEPPSAAAVSDMPGWRAGSRQCSNLTVCCCILCTLIARCCLRQIVSRDTRAAHAEQLLCWLRPGTACRLGGGTGYTCVYAITLFWMFAALVKLQPKVRLVKQKKASHLLIHRALTLHHKRVFLDVHLSTPRHTHASLVPSSIQTDISCFFVH